MSLGPASRLLGVDPDTLRRWADEGRVPSWTTPGGHRRFDRPALEHLADVRRHDSPHHSLSDLGASPERLHRVYHRRYADELAATTNVGAVADPVDRLAARDAGRRLIESLVAYLDAQPDDATGRGASAEAEAVISVDHYGALAAAVGTSLTEAVEMFVRAREPFLAEIAGIGRRRSLDPAHLADLYADASAVLDRLLLRFIDSHQRAAGGDDVVRGD